MPSNYPSDGIFNLHRTAIRDFFYLHALPLTVALKCVIFTFSGQFALLGSDIRK